MTARQIDRERAKEFFSHKSQRPDFGIEDMPPDGVADYWASGPICGVFIFGLWYDTWNAHYGVKPEGWGRLVEPAREVLSAYWDHKGAQLITGYTAASNRAAVSFARRIGFKEMGRMPHPRGTVIMQGWKKCR